MRIRKRQVPFPLSSLSPVPLSSDPLSPVVQLHLRPPPLPILPDDDDDTAEYFNAPSSSHHHHPTHPIQVHIQKDELESNDSRSNDLFLGAKMDTSHSHQGEKANPLKKRRGNNNKKCVEQNDDEDDKDYEEEEEEEEKRSMKSSVKKRGRGGAIMEGSRCSRVNGRGWRCCQQTLVGYSLCEHHLGKGRLTSMTSVRSRSVAANAKLEDRKKKLKHHDYSKLIDDHVESKQPLMSKRKTKLGIVKARSMSSLLGQENNVISIAEK